MLPVIRASPMLMTRLLVGAFRFFITPFISRRQPPMPRRYRRHAFVLSASVVAMPLPIELPESARSMAMIPPMLMTIRPYDDAARLGRG